MYINITFVKDTPKSNGSNGIYKTLGQHLTSQSAEVSILNASKKITLQRTVFSIQEFKLKVLLSK